MKYLRIKIGHAVKTPRWWLLILLPVLMGFFWGLAGKLEEERGDSYYIGIVDYDQSQRSRSLIAALERHPSLELILYKDKASAAKALTSKTVLQTYILLDGFETHLNEGHYDDLIEVVSMIESPYSDWLNDQVSVSVIREWLISDGYQRISSFNSAYPRTLYEEAFKNYYEDNALLIFNEIYRNKDLSQSQLQSTPYYVKGFCWAWCLYLLSVCLGLTRQFYREKHVHLITRLKLSGVSLFSYLSEYFLWLCAIGVIGGLASYSVFVSFIARPSFSAISLLRAIFLLGILLVLFSYIMSRIKLSLNQISLLCILVFIGWSVLATSAITALPMGRSLQYVSPLTFFFKLLI